MQVLRPRTTVATARTLPRAKRDQDAEFPRAQRAPNGSRERFVTHVTHAWLGLPDLPSTICSATGCTGPSGEIAAWTRLNERAMPSCRRSWFPLEFPQRHFAGRVLFEGVTIEGRST
jgi:hypothetical protein